MLQAVATQSKVILVSAGYDAVAHIAAAAAVADLLTLIDSMFAVDVTHQCRELDVKQPKQHPLEH